jgi:hypothetical protein
MMVSCRGVLWGGGGDCCAAKKKKKSNPQNSIAPAARWKGPLQASGGRHRSVQCMHPQTDTMCHVFARTCSK